MNMKIKTISLENFNRKIVIGDRRVAHTKHVAAGKTVTWHTDSHLMKAVSDLLLALRVSQNTEITIIFELFNYNLLSLMQNGCQCK